MALRDDDYARALDHARFQKAQPSVPPTNAPLREIAGRIKSLSYTDMLRLAAELTHTDHLADVGAINETARRLLAAADNLATA